LKIETANWKSVPQKAVNIHTPHPLIATRKNIVTLSLSPPQTINSRDTKKMKGPITFERDEAHPYYVDHGILVSSS
jgi:hypothetical protein